MSFEMKLNQKLLVGASEDEILETKRVLPSHAATTNFTNNLFFLLFFYIVSPLPFLKRHWRVVCASRNTWRRLKKSHGAPLVAAVASTVH